jgi:anthranilate 1,2-dioxygenase reductase subunit
MQHSVALNFADGKTFFIAVDDDELLLDAALRQGIKLPLDCREGVCGTCQGQCDGGQYQQDYVDEEALSARDVAEGKILACQTRVSSDAAFYFEHSSTLCNAGESLILQTTVRALEFISDSTAILQLDASLYAQTLQFLPGQYARLQIPESDQWRAYSFANRPHPDNQLQFLIRLLPDGAMSNFLRQHCQLGQQLAMQAPLGSFYLRDSPRPRMFIAGGTGLSAFLGMLDHLADSADPAPIQLYYGVSQQQDLCEQDRLQGYAKRMQNFCYHPIVSQASNDWQGKTGHVQQHLDASLLNDQGHDLYVCGPPAMIESVKEWLQQQQIADYRLFSEKFLHNHRP